MNKNKKELNNVFGGSLRLTESEHEYLVRRVKIENLINKKAGIKKRISLNKFILNKCLNYEKEREYTEAEIQFVRKAGHRFNAFVYGLHINAFVDTGEKILGRRHVNDVFTELILLQETLASSPVKSWRTKWGGQIKRGEGVRKKRGCIRCSRPERDRIKARASAARMSVESYIRACIFKRPVGRKSFLKMQYQWIRIETNLHQMLEIRDWNHPELEDILEEIRVAIAKRVFELGFFRRNPDYD